MEWLPKKYLPLIPEELSELENSSVFVEVFKDHRGENFHSDLFYYYLRFPLALKYFLQWMKTKNPSIALHEYSQATIRREWKRIDILILNNDKTKAIVFENKSNNAGDMPEQLMRYREELYAEGIFVDGYLYLNHSTLKEPDYAGEAGYEKIEPKLVIGQLIGGDHSFVHNVIEPTLRDSNDIRLSALSKELNALFSTIVYGGFNMENMKEFVNELKKGSNYAEALEFSQRLEQVGQFQREEFFNYCQDEYKGITLKKFYSVDISFVNINFNDALVRFELLFNLTGVTLTIVDSLGRTIEDLITEMGDSWPFSATREKKYNDRFGADICAIFETEELKRRFDSIIRLFFGK